MKDHIQIALVGEDGVGKSSLLSAYLSRRFPQQVPSVLVDVRIPASATVHGSAVTLIDTCRAVQSEETIKSRLSTVDSIIAVYDVTRPETLQALVDYWLPMIHDIALMRQRAETSSPVETEISSFNGAVSSSSVTSPGVLPSSGSSSGMRSNKDLGYLPVIVLGTKMDLLVSEEELNEVVRREAEEYADELLPFPSAITGDDEALVDGRGRQHRGRFGASLFDDEDSDLRLGPLRGDHFSGSMNNARDSTCDRSREAGSWMSSWNTKSEETSKSVRQTLSAAGQFLANWTGFSHNTDDLECHCGEDDYEDMYVGDGDTGSVDGLLTSESGGQLRRGFNSSHSSLHAPLSSSPSRADFPPPQAYNMVSTHHPFSLSGGAATAVNGTLLFTSGDDAGSVEGYGHFDSSFGDLSSHPLLPGELETNLPVNYSNSQQLSNILRDAHPTHLGPGSEEESLSLASIQRKDAQQTQLIHFMETDLWHLQQLCIQFPFVLQVWKCSAAKLQDIDQVFYYGQLFVSYPIHRLYDMNCQEFTPICCAAFQRIFRIFDLDGDGYLDDREISESQMKCFDLAIDTEELRAMKKEILKHAGEGGIHHNKLTFEGFLALMRLLVENHEFQDLWAVLMRFNYDESLELKVPDTILTPPVIRKYQVPQLSHRARNFLKLLAKSAYDEHTKPLEGEGEKCGAVMENCLTAAALEAILSVFPPNTSHPWRSPPKFKSQWDTPRVSSLKSLYKGLTRPWRGNNSNLHRSRASDLSFKYSAISKSPIVIDSSSDSHLLDPAVVPLTFVLPGLPHAGATLSIDDWLLQWELLAATNPVLTQRLLFYLGYVERPDLGVVASSGTFHHQYQLSHIAVTNNLSTFTGVQGAVHTLPSSSSQWPPNKPPLERSCAHIVVLGGNSVGKSSFVWKLSGLSPPGTTEFGEKTIDTAKPIDSVVTGGMTRSTLESHLNTAVGELVGTRLLWDEPEWLTSVESFCITAVPFDQTDGWLRTHAESCDCVILMSEAGNMESLDIAFAIEKKLPRKLPRIYLTNKSDKVNIPASNTTKSTSTEEKISSTSGDLNAEEVRKVHSRVSTRLQLHLSTHDLLAPVNISAVTGEGLSEALLRLHSAMTDPIHAIPFNRRSVVPPMDGRVLAGVTVTAGFVLLFTLQRHREVLTDFVRHPLDLLSRVVNKTQDQVKDVKEKVAAMCAHILDSWVSPLQISQ